MFSYHGTYKRTDGHGVVYYSSWVAGGQPMSYSTQRAIERLWCRWPWLTRIPKPP